MISFTPIGVVHNDINKMSTGNWADAESTIELDPDLVPGLQGLADFSHVVVVFHLDRIPPFDKAKQLLTEAGYPFHNYSWYGVFAPAKTPQPIVDRLRSEFVKTMAMPDVVERFEKGSGRVLSMGQAETEKYVTAEIARWTAIIKKAGITIQE